MDFFFFSLCIRTGLVIKPKTKLKTYKKKINHKRKLKHSLLHKTKIIGYYDEALEQPLY